MSSSDTAFRVLDSISDLDDVALATPTQGQSLTFNASTSKWINSTVTGGGTTTVSPATATNAGTMSSTHFVAVNNRTAAATPLTVVQRDTVGGAAFAGTLSLSNVFIQSGTTFDGGDIVIDGGSLTATGTTVDLSTATVSLPWDVAALVGDVSSVQADVATIQSEIPSFAALSDLSDHVSLSTTAHGGIVPSSRLIKTTSPLTINGTTSGALSATTTIALAANLLGTSPITINGTTSGALSTTTTIALAANLVGTSPVTINGTTSGALSATTTIAVAAATATNAGTQSTTHFSLLNTATSAATASTLMVRDANGNARVGAVYGATTGMATNSGAGPVNVAINATKGWHVSIVVSLGDDYHIGAPTGAISTQRLVMKILNGGDDNVLTWDPIWYFPNGITPTPPMIVDEGAFHFLEFIYSQTLANKWICVTQLLNITGNFLPL